MTPPRLAIIGHGKMGRAVEALAIERGFTIAAVIDHPPGSPPRLTARDLGNAEVAIEFTEPAAAPGNIQSSVAAGCPIVVGTTGWYDSLPDVTEAVRRANGTMLWAPNFSLGVQLLTEVLAEASKRLARLPGFHAHIVETHHAAKLDAPSGTAQLLQRVGSDALGREIPITSVRTGFVPGTHDIIFDGQFEQILLRHAARDRRVFADGALRAAEWLAGRRGVFQLRDMLAQGTT